MPALHIHDVARIAHDTFDGPEKWGDEPEHVRKGWRELTQLLIDGDETRAGETLAADRIDTGEWELLINLTAACRPFTEE